jgi:Tfp pilus assembly protein PilW
MPRHTTKTQPTGFTLIELLITTTLTVMLMLTITTLFMTFLLSNSKTNIRKEIKEEGLHALNQMEFLIRNARSYDTNYTSCGSHPNIKIIGVDGGETRLIETGGQIASNSAILTSQAVTLSNLNFECSGDAGNRQIKIKFSLTKLAPTLGASENITEDFESTVNMRN